MCVSQPVISFPPVDQQGSCLVLATRAPLSNQGSSSLGHLFRLLSNFPPSSLGQCLCLCHLPVLHLPLSHQLGLASSTPATQHHPAGCSLQQSLQMPAWQADPFSPSQMPHWLNSMTLPGLDCFFVHPQHTQLVVPLVLRGSLSLLLLSLSPLLALGFPSIP